VREKKKLHKDVFEEDNSLVTGGGLLRGSPHGALLLLASSHESPPRSVRTRVCLRAVQRWI